jgi:3-oxoacyl-[acyl-carrier protein] reductase
VKDSGGVERCAAVQAELASSVAARSLITAAVERFGKVDIVVGNHGIWPPQDAPVDQMSDEQWRSTMAINLDSIFGLVKHGVAQMKKQRSGGHVVLISSTAGQRGEAFHCDYAASKGAVISMVKGLSTELARDGIYVNCVAPGWVETDMAAPALHDPEISKRVFSTIPLGRAGTPQEIAASVLFLCTPHAGFITGEVLNVNGGAVLVG